MKKKWILIGSLLVSMRAFSQTAPLGTPPGNSTSERAVAAWYRGGNNFGGTTPPGANIFGTLWNSPIYTQTFDVTRMRLNGNLNANISVYPNNNVNGYLGLGTFIQGGVNFWENNSPFSQLHLVGRQGNEIQNFGYRPWMQTGITLTDNQDLSYIGLRAVGNANDNTETVITWTDNWGPPVGSPNNFGPDDLSFRFTAEGIGTQTNQILDDLGSPFDLDGLHISRFSSTGLIGFGNTFGINPSGTPLGLYIRPMSLLHLSYQMRNGNAFEGYGFQQITYRRPVGSTTDLIGQGEQETDGLRLGIDNQNWGTTPTTAHLNSFLRWQEASSFIIQSEDGGAPNIEANERMRVTSIGALNLNYTGAQYFGLNANNNATRISISENGSIPLTRPKSLLHLGYDYGNLGTGVEGFRTWMDLGMLTSTNEDHIWIGLKPRLATNAPVTTNVNNANDALDAAIAWGTDRNATTPAAVDNMRFIFTGNLFSGPDGAPSTQEDGLEMMRMYPATVYTHQVLDANGNPIGTQNSYGRVGIGDFTAMGVNEAPTQKLDVIGNGRFRYLPDAPFEADNSVEKVVMVDESGVLRWKDASAFGGGSGGGSIDGAHNGTSVSTYDNTKVAFGQSVGQSGNPAMLIDTREVPMNNQNIVFTVPGSAPSAAGNNVGFGLNNPTSQVHIKTFTNSGTSTPFRVDDSNNNLSVAIKDNQRVGIGTANPQASLELKSLPGSGVAPGMVLNSETNFPSNFITFQQNNIGKFVMGHYNDVLTLGSGNQNAPDAYMTLNSAAQTVTFSKPVEIGTLTVQGQNVTSDRKFKTEIETIDNPLDIINKLNARSYYFDTVKFQNSFDFEKDLQYGFIAQEIEQVLPDLVSTIEYPEKLDAQGNRIADPMTYKSVEYLEIIPITVGAIQDLSDENDSLRREVANLNDRLSTLENCLSALLPTLCQMNQQAIQANTPEAQEQLRKNIAVTLSNQAVIVLDQNVPNPFAEQTVINFSIPETIQKAQIHFYNEEGKIIQSVDIPERGLGSLTVFGADLSTGVYSYTLVADGKIVSTKKMVKIP